MDRNNTNNNADCFITPPVYHRWRASTLGQITDQLEGKMIRESLPPLRGIRALDVGCGDGLLTLWLHRQGANVEGTDISEEMLDAASARFDAAGAAILLSQADTASLPFKDDQFELVTAVTILCFVNDPAPVFAELYRVLKPGGRLVIGELGRWSFWAAWRRLKAWAGSALWRQASFRSPRELIGLATGAGFQVRSLRGGIFYPPIGFVAQLLCRFDRWIGRHGTFGAAFLVVDARKPMDGSGTLRTARPV